MTSINFDKFFVNINIIKPDILDYVVSYESNILLSFRSIFGNDSVQFKSMQSFASISIKFITPKCDICTGIISRLNNLIFPFLFIFMLPAKLYYFGIIREGFMPIIFTKSRQGTILISLTGNNNESRLQLEISNDPQIHDKTTINQIINDVLVPDINLLSNQFFYNNKSRSIIKYGACPPKPLHIGNLCWLYSLMNFLSCLTEKQFTDLFFKDGQPTTSMKRKLDAIHEFLFVIPAKLRDTNIRNIGDILIDETDIVPNQTQNPATFLSSLIESESTNDILQKYGIFLDPSEIKIKQACAMMVYVPNHWAMVEIKDNQMFLRDMSFYNKRIEVLGNLEPKYIMI